MSTTTDTRTRIRSLVTIRSMLKVIATLVAAVCLATFAAGGTYAFWNSSATAGAATTIKSGTAALTVSVPLAMPTTGMYPGVTLYGSATLSNTGDIALVPRLTSLTAPAANAFSTALSVYVGRAASAAACSSGAITGATVVPFGSTAPVALGAPILKATTGVVCVAIALPTSAANGGQGLSASGFTLTLDGNQA